MKPAEFDRHAADYDGGLDNPIKRMMGNSQDQFIAVKARWLLRREPALSQGGLDLLDYGCGTADLLRVLAGLGARATFAGCDVSTGMLAEVAKRWPQGLGPTPEIAAQEGALTRSPAAVSMSSPSARCCITCRRWSVRRSIASWHEC